MIVTPENMRSCTFCSAKEGKKTFFPKRDFTGQKNSQHRNCPNRAWYKAKKLAGNIAAGKRGNPKPSFVPTYSGPKYPEFSGMLVDGFILGAYSLVMRDKLAFR